MTFSIIEGFRSTSTNINIFNSDTTINTLKYDAGMDVTQILVNTAGTRMYSLSRFDNTIISYNLTTSTIEFTITSIPSPVAGILSYNGNYLYVISLINNYLYRISLTDPSHPVTSTPLSLVPTKLVTTSTDSKIYLAGFSTVVSVVDTATFLESETIILYTATAYYKPYSLLITSDDSTLIIADNRYSAITTLVLATNTVRFYPLTPYAVNIFLTNAKLSADNSTVYALGRFRTFGYVLKLGLNNGVITFQYLATTPTRIQAIVISPDQTKLYLLNIITKKIDMLLASDFSSLPSITLPQPPYYFFIDSLLNLGYAVNKNSGLITKINTVTNAVITSIPSVYTITAITAHNL